MYTHFKLNVTIFLSTSINAPFTAAGQYSSEIIKIQIIEAFQNLVREKCNYPKTSIEIIIKEQAIFNIEVDREGQLNFNVIHCLHPIISTSLANSLSGFHEEWKKYSPAPWKESITFKMTIDFVINMEEDLSTADVFDKKRLAYPIG